MGSPAILGPCYKDVAPIVGAIVLPMQLAGCLQLTEGEGRRCLRAIRPLQTPREFSLGQHSRRFSSSLPDVRQVADRARPELEGVAERAREEAARRAPVVRAARGGQEARPGAVG